VLKLIVAKSIDGVIGIDNDIPWINSFKEDLKWFCDCTMGSRVIMGRKTAESLSRPLKNRTHFVASRSTDMAQCKNGTLLPVEDLESIIKKNKAVDAWIIGGSEIYEQCMPYCREMYVTVIPEHYGFPKGACYFPRIDTDEWMWKTIPHPYNSELILQKWTRK
jgi:dihydrofolate reductase